MAQHAPLSRLLSANAQWASDLDVAEPGFFTKSATGQYPKVLWIGCSDSRVPESVVTAAKPGDIFVHRNIANQFHPDDDSVLSVLKYAVEVVGVEHVVVVGHSNCGGVKACLSASHPQAAASPPGPLSRWLAPLTGLATSLKLADTPHDKAISILAEENVKAQVANLCKSETIQHAWSPESKNKPFVHGWLYEIESGRLKDLGVSSGSP